MYKCRHTIVTHVYKIAIGFQGGALLSKKHYSRCMLHTYLTILTIISSIIQDIMAMIMILKGLQMLHLAPTLCHVLFTYLLLNGSYYYPHFKKKMKAQRD